MFIKDECLVTHHTVRRPSPGSRNSTVCSREYFTEDGVEVKMLRKNVKPLFFELKRSMTEKNKYETNFET